MWSNDTALQQDTKTYFSYLTPVQCSACGTRRGRRLPAEVLLWYVASVSMWTRRPGIDCCRGYWLPGWLLWLRDGVVCGMIRCVKWVQVLPPCTVSPRSINIPAWLSVQYKLHTTGHCCSDISAAFQRNLAVEQAIVNAYSRRLFLRRHGVCGITYSLSDLSYYAALLLGGARIADSIAPCGCGFDVGLSPVQVLGPGIFCLTISAIHRSAAAPSDQRSWLTPEHYTSAVEALYVVDHHHHHHTCIDTCRAHGML